MQSVLIDKVETMDDRFVSAEIEAFATGDNCHTLPISLETLKASADTIYDVPITYAYNEVLNDYEGHEIDQVPLGFVKEDKENNPVRFEEKEDGRIFLKIKGKLWKKYGGNFMEIFSKTDNKKSVSVELTVIDGEMAEDGRIIVRDLVYDAITVLGSHVCPAISGANIALAFSNDKQLYLQRNFSTDNSGIKINNSKDRAVFEEWSNPHKKLFIPLSEATNKIALLMETYLDTGNSILDRVSMNKVDLAHHVLEQGELVLHVGGLKTAFEEITSKSTINQLAMEHIKRHYDELGLNSENYQDFGFNNIQYDKYFAKNLGEEETKLDFGLTMEQKRELLASAVQKVFVTANDKGESYCDVWVRDYDETYVYVRDYSDCLMYRVEYVMLEDTTIEIKADTKQQVLEGYVPLTETEESEFQSFAVEYAEKMKKETFDDDDNDDDKNDDDDSSDDDNDDDKNDDNGSEDNTEEDFSKKLEELTQKYVALEEENKAYMEKIATMSDYEELKEFKRVTCEQQAKEAEMAEMKEVMSKIVERGTKFSEEQVNELYAKKEEFENVNAWSNYVKAFAYDNCSTINDDGDIVKMALPNSQENNDTSDLDVWDVLKNKFN